MYVFVLDNDVVYTSFPLFSLHYLCEINMLGRVLVLKISTTGRIPLLSGSGMPFHLLLNSLCL